MEGIPPPVDTHVPKGPNFGLVVAIAVVLLFVILAAAYVLLHHDARKLMLQPQTHASLILR
jgi:hypothetical protein